MAKQRTKTEVDEQYLMQIMAGDVPPKQDSEENIPEKSLPPEEKEPEVAVEKKETPTKRKRGNISEYEATFLKRNAISDRRLTYVSSRNYDKIAEYINVLDRNQSIAGYIDNIISHHLEQYKDVINELYESKIRKPF